MSLMDPDKVLGDRIPGFLVKPVAKWIGIDWFNERYDESSETVKVAPKEEFFRTILNDFGMDYDIVVGDPSLIPPSGPVLVVSNHPFGGGDALIMADLINRVRPDSLILGNYLLSLVPQLSEYIIDVDPFGGKEAPRQNVRAIRKAINHLRGGGLVALFPAGEVASFQLTKMRVVEKEWSSLVSQLVRKTDAPVVPVHFQGGNSAMFHCSGLIHPMLRTAQLIREMRRLSGRTIPVRIGRPISANELPRAGDGGARFLKQHVERLGQLRIEDNRWQRGRDGETRSPDELEPIIPPIPTEKLAAEVAALSEDHFFVERGEWRVFLASAEEIPNCLREIGRLREITFRGVGEGTGREIDLDRFDQWYLHLVLWNDRLSEIAGAYRFGPTLDIIPERGLEGLYTHNLFRYHSDFFKKTDPVLEVGRAFVVDHYQRSFASLSLLWKGIGTFYRRNPEYRYAIGPVSISSDYQMISRQLIMRFLQKNFWSMKHSKMVKSPTPPGKKEYPHYWSKTHLSDNLDTIGEINGAVSAIEPDGKGLPVLIRQYLKFETTFIGFNVDHDFSGVIDGLILVDFARTDRRTGNRLLGEGVIEAVRSRHPVEED